jgi:hypothetical protein
MKDELEIQIGRRVWRGEEAFRLAEMIVLATGSVGAFVILALIAWFSR